jgi:HEAT repeat protein
VSIDQLASDTGQPSTFGSMELVPEHAAPSGANSTRLTVARRKNLPRQQLSASSDSATTHSYYSWSINPVPWSHSSTPEMGASQVLARLLSFSRQGQLGEGEYPEAFRFDLHVAFLNDPAGAANEVLEFATRERVPPDVLYAICDAVGHINFESGRLAALALLTELLNRPQAATRDAALLGIGLLRDRRATPALMVAQERETRRFLKETFAGRPQI